jgi:hypothetical protein
MASIALLGAAFAGGGAAAYLAFSRHTRQLKRESYIRQFVFPSAVLQSLTKTYPHLEEKDQFLVAHALRSYFLVHLRSRDGMVGMPSRAVDVLWHEFILDTKGYHAFCSKAFGDYFHHIPAGRVAYKLSPNDGLRLTWRLACLEENIDPRNATRLPLLFAIDAKLKIPDGQIYDLEETRKAPRTDSGGCSGLGSSGGGDSCDSSSDGGGGCGGGCGGD